MFLNCKTWFSLRYGTIKTEALVGLAAAHGAKALALTNINNTTDLWDFVAYCQAQNIKPIAGVEVRNDHNFLYILLAKNNEGLYQIHKFLSHHLQSKTPFPSTPALDENVFIIYPFGFHNVEDLNCQEFIGIQAIELNKLYGFNVADHSSKFVIRHPVTFNEGKSDYNIHQLLRAIDKNVIGTKLTQQDVAGKHEFFIQEEALKEIFEEHPTIIAATEKLMDSCTIDIEFSTDKTKKLYSTTEADDKKLLKKLAFDGMERRYGKNNAIAKQRITKELKIINDLNFTAYFLITWDIIRYAKSREFFYVGRGSGANSIVAYCLEITDVDPLELDLYFERFLNPKRSVPPDFDIDFSWTDRDEMIDYIFTRYGHDHVSLIAAYTTFQSKAVVRELGKVFGLPKEEIDQLDTNIAKPDKIFKQILHYGSLLQDFPNNLSIHAGGMLISHEPLNYYSATALPPKGFPHYTN